MKEYKIKIKKRLSLMALCSSLFMIVPIIISQANIEAFESTFIVSFMAGLFIVFEIALIMGMLKYIKALKDDKYLKDIYTKETDERTAYISSKISKMAFATTIIVLTIATVISAFFSTTVFFTLIVVINLIALIKAIYMFYYNKKY